MAEGQETQTPGGVTGKPIFTKDTEETPAAEPTTPTFEFGGKSYTAEEAAKKIETSAQAFQRLQSERDRLANQVAQVQDFEQQQRDVLAIREALASDPGFRKIVEDYVQSQTAPAGTPAEGQPQEIPEYVQRLNAEVQALKQERDDAEARGKWSQTRSAFSEWTGRDMTRDDAERIAAKCWETGSIDPQSVAFYLYRDEIMQQQGQAKAQGIQNAMNVANQMTVEGAAGGDQSQPIDLSKASVDELARLGRLAAGGSSEDDYNPYKPL